jgi:hypothetical protein
MAELPDSAAATPLVTAMSRLPISAAIIETREPPSVIDDPLMLARLYDGAGRMFPAADSVPKRSGFD